MGDQKRDSQPDSELAAEFARSRDGRAFDELVRRHYGSVVAGANAVLRNREDAADVAQETFVRALSHAASFRGGSFRAWLYTVSRRLSVDSLMSRKPVRELAESAATTPGEAAVVRSEVEQVLAKLSRPQRICLVLFYRKGMTFREIAQHTGYSEKAVKSHIQNGRGRFKRLWERRAPANER